jgi:hypothetical protein
MKASYPGPNFFGASGHADFFNGVNFNGNGYFNANGGVENIYFWVLN